MQRALCGSAAALAWAALPAASWARAGEAAAPATPPEVSAALPGARLAGQARLRYLGLRIYDARLWVASGFEPEAYDRHPFALELHYARALRGALIAERSIEEMHRQGPIAEAQAGRWLAFLRQALPDVAEGDRLTGVHAPGQGARFLHNGERLRELRDPDFAQRFFGIWLAPQTSEPGLRAELIGEGAR